MWPPCGSALAILLRSVSIRGQFAAFCLDWGPICCVLPRIGAVSLRSASIWYRFATFCIWVRFAGLKSLRNAAKRSQIVPESNKQRPQIVAERSNKRPQIVGEHSKNASQSLQNGAKNWDPVPPGGRKTVAAGNPAFLLWPFGRSTHFVSAARERIFAAGARGCARLDDRA